MDFSKGPSLGANIPTNTSNNTPSPVTSICYHSDGINLFVATEADSKLQVINATTGQSDQPPYRCEREGISIVSATHHPHCVLFGSPKNNAVHYWSLYDNKIQRKFRGHSGPVHEISLCPGEDMFLTASTDRTVRLWNIQQAGCIAQMELPSDTEGRPHAVFDSTGMVFALMAGMGNGQGHHIHLYDARNYSGGAFSELQVLNTAVREAMGTHRITSVPQTEQLTFNSLKFNLSGNRMLAQTDQGLAVVLDGYEGTVQRIFQAETSGSRGTVSCFTPDDQSLLMGTDDGTIDCWNIQSGIHVQQLKGNSGPVRALDCNPKYQQIASSCTSTCLWIW